MLIPMRICRNMSPLPRDSFANSHRRFGRVRCSQIGCSIGQVLDLSAGGMRVRCPTFLGLRDGECVGVTLQAGAILVPLPCRIVWMRKPGWRTLEVGLTFLELTPVARQSLNDVARAITRECNLSSGALGNPAA